MVTEYFGIHDIERLSGSAQIRGVVHIGGHTGEEANNYRYPDVVWVEAHPEYYERMVSHISAFGQNHHVNACLSDVEETVQFWVTADEFASSFLHPGYHQVQNPHAPVVDSITLQTERFDSLWSRMGYDKLDINMAVVDTQGSELKVLKGMGTFLRQFDIIVTEYSTVSNFYIGGAMLDDIDAYLEGFVRVFPEEPIMHGDAIYVREQYL